MERCEYLLKLRAGRVPEHPLKRDWMLEMSNHKNTYPSIYLSIYLSVYIHISLYSCIYVSIYLSICIYEHVGGSMRWRVISLSHRRSCTHGPHPSKISSTRAKVKTTPYLQNVGQNEGKLPRSHSRRRAVHTRCLPHTPPPECHMKRDCSAPLLYIGQMSLGVHHRRSVGADLAVGDAVAKRAFEQRPYRAVVERTWNRQSSKAKNLALTFRKKKTSTYFKVFPLGSEPAKRRKALRGIISKVNS